MGRDEKVFKSMAFIFAISTFWFGIWSINSDSEYFEIKNTSGYKGQIKWCVEHWGNNEVSGAKKACLNFIKKYNKKDYPHYDLRYATVTSILCRIGVRGNCKRAALNYYNLKRNYYGFQMEKIGCFKNKEFRLCSDLGKRYYWGEKYSSVQFIKKAYRRKQVELENASCDGRWPLSEDFDGYYINCYRAIYQSFTQKSVHTEYLEKFCKIRQHPTVQMSDFHRDMFTKELKLCEKLFPLEI